LTGSGGLFTTVGRLAGWLRNFNGILGTTAPSPSSTWGSSGTAIACLNDNVNNYVTQLQANANLASLTNNVYSQMRDQLRTGVLSYLLYAQTQSKTIVQSLASADQSPNPVIPTPTVAFQNALLYLINQMAASGTYLAPSTVSASVAAGSGNTGNGTCMASVKRGDGTNQQYLYAETVNLLCTSDSQVSTGNLNVEPFSFAGAGVAGNTLGWDWPAGSGAAGSLSAVNAANQTPNFLSNGDFETYTVANIPDGWTVVTGTPGTDFGKDTSEFYTGSSCFDFVGTGGAPNSELYFPLTGVQPDTVYFLNCWMRKANSLATGVLRLALTDATNTAVNDDAGNANSISQTLNSLTTSFAPVQAVFVTPKALPSAVRLNMKLTTGISTVGGRAAIDRMALVTPTPAYGSTRGGPRLAVFSGSTPFLVNDSFAVTVANNYSGLWQLMVWQLFDPGLYGYQFPYSGGGSAISASLIG
jgi:hypothetical protein